MLPGTKVIKVLHGAGYSTEEHGVVLKVDDAGVWLDNGEGNRPSGPFINNRMDGVFGFWEEIIACTCGADIDNNKLHTYDCALIRK